MGNEDALLSKLAVSYTLSFYPGRMTTPFSKRLRSSNTAGGLFALDAFAFTPHDLNGMCGNCMKTVSKIYGQTWENGNVHASMMLPPYHFGYAALSYRGGVLGWYLVPQRFGIYTNLQFFDNTTPSSITVSIRIDHIEFEFRLSDSYASASTTGASQIFIYLPKE